MSKQKLQQVLGLARDPRILVILAPFVLMAPVWAAGKALYWGTPSTQFIPWWHQAWQTLRAGQLPLWNPLLGMGAPLLANYQSALLYPPNWLYFLLAELGGLPWMAWGMTPMIAAHLAWAGLGMLLLVRRLGLGILAQSVGGLAFGLSGYLVARAHFLSINAAVAWLPWILFAAYDLVQQPKAKSVLKLALLLAFQWLAGHAQISWYTLLLLVAWTAFWAWNNGGWTLLRRVAGLLLAAAVLALLLSAMQLLPTAEYLSNSQRASEVESTFAFSYSFWPWRLLGLLAPNLFGSPTTGDYWGFANYWEDAIYMGLLPILLALAAILGKKRNEKASRLGRFLALTTLVSFLLALGNNTPIFPWLYRNIPSFDMFQAPTRFTLWAVFALSLLAALAAQSWSRPTGRALYWSRLAVAASIAISLGAVGVSFLDLGALPSIEPSLVRATSSLGLIALGITLLNLFAPQTPRTKSHTWTWAVVLLLSADLIWAGWGLNPGTELDFYRQQENEYSVLKEQLGEGRIYLPRADEDELKFERFFRFDNFETGLPARNVRSALLPNTNLLVGIPSANNFDPLVPERYRNWIDLMESPGGSLRQDMLAQTSVSVIEEVADDQMLQLEYTQIEALPRLRWLPCARFVGDQEEALKLIASGELGPGTVLIEATNAVEQEICESASIWNGRIEWLHQSPNYLLASISAPDGGWLLLADTWYPGWLAKVDGGDVLIYPANAVFRSLQLSRGEHKVELLYRPLSFTIGATVSIAAWLGLLIFWHKLKED